MVEIREKPAQLVAQTPACGERVAVGRGGQREAIGYATRPPSSE